MKVKLHQINLDRDTNRVAFMGLDFLERFQGTSAIDASIYDCVFDGDIPRNTLEGAYQFFNAEDRPGAHEFHSMSVSDILEVCDGNGVNAPVPGFYFCDSIGFKPVSINAWEGSHGN